MRAWILPVALPVVLWACSPEPPAPGSTQQSGEAAPETVAGAPVDTAAADVPVNPLREAYFGDVHVHTILSFDAFLMGTRRTPEDAYTFAKGGAIEHASGFMMQMKKPLDFLAVSDHGFYLGMMREIAEGRIQHELGPIVSGATSVDGSRKAFAAAIAHVQKVTADPALEDDLDNRAVARSAWQEIIEAAERNNDPGNFTAFIGYEYTSSGPEFQNLHRNVIFRGSEVPAQPFVRLDSVNPEDLWDWMDGNRDRGMDAIAIPHNSNGSDGWMFQTTDFAGGPMDAAYAEQRMRNEPVVENT